ncbi:hypothetical protein [Kitasatospora cinereorecta]|uniref:Uncharacterized protein n=1 Tax=Kitasatospora cinereorecta TaxID=285560 RepID=A0ABW0VEF8_9ACTN
MSGQDRVYLRRLLGELADLGDDIDPFEPDDSGAQLFTEIAQRAERIARFAWDLVTEAQNTATENGKGIWWLSN